MGITLSKMAENRRGRADREKRPREIIQMGVTLSKMAEHMTGNGRVERMGQGRLFRWSVISGGSALVRLRSCDDRRLTSSGGENAGRDSEEKH
jgi:hypothetical protein